MPLVHIVRDPPCCAPLPNKSRRNKPPLDNRYDGGGTGNRIRSETRILFCRSELARSDDFVARYSSLAPFYIHMAFGRFPRKTSPRQADHRTPQGWMGMRLLGIPAEISAGQASATVALIIFLFPVLPRTVSRPNYLGLLPGLTRKSLPTSLHDRSPSPSCSRQAVWPVVEESVY